MNAWKQQSWMVLLLRWLGGGFAGFVVGLLLLILGQTVHPPLVGPIIVGQQLLFYELLFDWLYSYFRSTTPVFEASLIVYSVPWITIGALFFSGHRRLIKTAMIFLVLYLIVGLLGYIYWAFRMFPT